MKRPTSWGLPLLAKELAEQSARPRTYMVRVLYAALLYIVGLLVYASITRTANNSVFAALGQGGFFFESLVVWQFVGIYLFMPAIACGAIAGEKERNSMLLLVLTKLGPTTILMEKFLGRLIPMLMFLLLCLPLLTIAYSLGGLTREYLWSGVLLLIVTVVQVGSFAIMCSAYFRTTVAAFIGCYILGVAYTMSPILIQEVAREVMGFDIHRWVQQNLLVPLDEWCYSWLGTQLELTRLIVPNMFLPFTLMGPARGGGQLSRLFISCLPTMASSIVFLLLARFFLLRRAFLEPRDMVLQFFRQLDSFFRRVNDNQLTRGIVLVKESSAMPEFAPLSWRETNKTTLGAFRYLVRLFVVIEFPVMVCCTLTALNDFGNAVSQYLALLLFLVWGMALLIVSIKASSLVNIERTRETLDVLLTTPISGREIVLQKMQGVWRLCIVVSVPLLTIVAFKTWWTAGTGSDTLRYSNASMGYPLGYAHYIYLTCALLTVLVYLPLIAWISLWFGLWIRHQTRAIFAALAAIIVWCVLPVFFVVIVSEMLGMSPGRGNPMFLLMLAGPATIIPANEFFALSDVFTDNAVVVVAINFVLYAVMLWLFRSLALGQVDRYLGRLELHTKDPTEEYLAGIRRSLASADESLSVSVH